jgi:hypothetical protein
MAPIGTVLPWPSDSSIPTGWHLCDGTGGTPNLKDRMIIGAGLNYAVGANGLGMEGDVLGSGTHTDGGASQGAHEHSFSGTSTESDVSIGMSNGEPGVSYDRAIVESHAHNVAFDIGPDGDHYHGLVGETGTATNITVSGRYLPSAIALYFIQRIS